MIRPRVAVRLTTNLIMATLVLFEWQTVTLGQGLPDGPGKDETARVCGSCHDTANAVAVRLTREGWQNLIVDMVNRGAVATDEDMQAILEYLTTHFPGDAARPLNINTATNVELESILQLLRKEATALIQYRQKHGKFKSIDELKKVPGVDFKKIESRKDRIVF